LPPIFLSDVVRRAKNLQEHSCFVISFHKTRYRVANNKHHKKNLNPILPGRRWIEIPVVFGCILLITAGLLPARQRARDAAQQTQSKNYLKQFGLAFHNYRDTCNYFPIGGDIETNGTAKHGWITRCIPYIESTPIYSFIEQDLPWDHPINYDVFQRDWPSARMTGVPEQFASDGCGLIHYMANPNIFHRNSTTTLTSIAEGISHNWLLAEVSGDYKPWGYPFNWRHLQLPFNSGNGSFGRPTADSVQLCMADGSVTRLMHEVHPSIVQNLATAGRTASTKTIQGPDLHFDAQP